MEFQRSDDEKAPFDTFDSTFGAFLERFRAADGDPAMFVQEAASNFAHYEATAAIDGVVAHTTISPYDATPLSPKHPAARAFRDGAMTALEAVRAWFPYSGWDKSVAAICREVTFGTDLAVLDAAENSFVEGSKRRAMREQMLLRAYAGLRAAATFSDLVPEIGRVTHPRNGVDFECGFGFVADAAIRYDASRRDFEAQAAYFLDTGREQGVSLDIVVERILEHGKRSSEDPGSTEES